MSLCRNLTFPRQGTRPGSAGPSFPPSQTMEESSYSGSSGPELETLPGGTPRGPCSEDEQRIHAACLDRVESQQLPSCQSGILLAVPLLHLPSAPRGR